MVVNFMLPKSCNKKTSNFSAKKPRPSGRWRPSERNRHRLAGHRVPLRTWHDVFDRCLEQPKVGVEKLHSVAMSPNRTKMIKNADIWKGCERLDDKLLDVNGPKTLRHNLLEHQDFKTWRSSKILPSRFLIFAACHTSSKGRSGNKAPADPVSVANAWRPWTSVKIGLKINTPEENLIKKSQIYQHPMSACWYCIFVSWK